MFDLGIVIVNWNTRDLLRECLRSVYASRGDFTFQVCVVDNGSGDGSAEIVRRRFPQAKLIALERNIGVGARNVGVDREPICGATTFGRRGCGGRSAWRCGAGCARRWTKPRARAAASKRPLPHGSAATRPEARRRAA